ncbi:hypothetical protein MIND_01058300 [Mycena indigotica]|uniref:Yeast cell wall synthesis Kre9/Knh1-like N-terminal domain-containing protein n=1 Tax=Mycena indigotica TaxID=2126181 RepID=A0A8H6SC93_9AGAR|nr:uncharacterized protein MIND_01058300 [Mycena indigotica]KAF7295195.1 hypothetical protein MIND_01058300 [Mycena indigotica]
MKLLAASLLLAASALSPASGYFVVTSPSLNDQWVNGETHQVSWSKGAKDGVTSFDIEMSQLSATGLTLIAKNVPSSDGDQKSINILLQDVPPGNDYFLLFLNSTHGVMHGTSPRFTILPAGSNGNISSTTNPKAATVTVSGSPNPTQAFATTFPLVASDARRRASPLLGVGLGSLIWGWAAWTMF